jgi:hypothetical protein
MRVSKGLWAALSVTLLLAAANCSDPAEKAGETASACGKRSCPAGTRPEESRMLDASNDISGGYDPATYKAEGAYKRSGSGSCEYACVVTQACPDNTFPIITDECFTCGAIDDEGQVDQGVCSDEAVVATECGKQTCPTGTVVIEKRRTESSKGYDVSQGFDPNKYDSELVPYLSFGEGECEYQCSPFQACPESTFPIITDDCFTCAYIDAQRGTVTDAKCMWKGPGVSSGGAGGSGNTAGAGGGGSGGSAGGGAGKAPVTEGGAGGAEG